jgi:hypothetical protein
LINNLINQYYAQIKSNKGTKGLTSLTPAEAAAAIMETLSLLLENEAIIRYIKETNNDLLRSSLPEIQTQEEVMMYIEGHQTLIV